MLVALNIQEKQWSYWYFDIFVSKSIYRGNQIVYIVMRCSVIYGIRAETAARHHRLPK